MKKKAFKIITSIHLVLLLWALLFIGSVFLIDNGQIVGIFAIGNILFMFANIPYSLFSVIFSMKALFSAKQKLLIAVLSLGNTLVSLGVWYVVYLISQKSQLY